jgi:hypothetical protein
MDWMDICMVADYSGDIENQDCTLWWGESKINIWTDWEKLTEQQVRAWSVNKRFSDGDRIASAIWEEGINLPMRVCSGHQAPRPALKGLTYYR